MADKKMGDLVGLMGGTTPTEPDDAPSMPPARRGAPPKRSAPPRPVEAAPEPEPEPDEAEPERKPAPTTRKSRARKQDNDAKAMPAQARAGDLLQVRVQPPGVGEWANNVINGASFAFNCSKGHIMGALLLIARSRPDEFATLLEEWAGEPTEQIRQMVWQQLKDNELG